MHPLTLQRIIAVADLVLNWPREVLSNMTDDWEPD